MPTKLTVAATALTALVLGTGCEALLHSYTFYRADADADAAQLPTDSGPTDAGLDAGTDAGTDVDAGPCPVCGGTTPMCDPSTGRCVACLANVDCEDGYLCTVDRCSLGNCTTTMDNSCITEITTGNSAILAPDVLAALSFVGDRISTVKLATAPQRIARRPRPWPA